MSTRYIPEPGDWFEAYERSGIRYRQGLEINLVAGHKACDGPFLCTSRDRLKVVETERYEFWITWYDFKIVKSPAPGVQPQSAG